MLIYGTRGQPVEPILNNFSAFTRFQNTGNTPFIALTLLVGRQEVHPACETLGIVFFDGDDLS